jgi:hypothetical protein
MKSVKLRVLEADWNLVEKFQTRTAMTAMTIQNTKLRSVEFKTSLQPAISGKTSDYINKGIISSL